MQWLQSYCFQVQGAHLDALALLLSLLLHHICGQLQQTHKHSPPSQRTSRTYQMAPKFLCMWPYLDALALLLCLLVHHLCR